MHWHIYPRRDGDTPVAGPVWQLGEELYDEKYTPTNEAEKLLFREIQEHENFVFASVKGDYGEDIYPFFRYAV